MKRILAILLVLAMLPIPATFALDEVPAAETIPQEAYDAVTADVWQTIEAIEETEIVAKRGKAADADSYASIVNDVIAAVEASDTFVEGSINRNGDFFTWETTEGIVCGYSPRLRAKIRANAVEGADAEDYAGVEVTSYATRGGSPSSMDVALIQPYYGIDSSFTTQYVNEAKSIAQATGGTSTTYKTTNATIDNIANALETCAVVIFDSHGDTDYYTSSGDYTSQANTSYLCLQSGTGLTTADQTKVTGTYGTYYHAYYAGAEGSMKYYCVDGTAIANHMDQTAPNNLLWMAICLGMATDGMQKPLRAKGVEVIYGYSQSVTFDGDYQWEEAFWDKMIAGENVATAISYMKSRYGIKDPYETSYPAYPIVVSSEDTYPGQGNVDKAQAVNSTWTLLSADPITLTLNDNGTVTTQTGTSFTLPTCTAPTGYTFAGWTTSPITTEVTAKPTLYAAGSTYSNGSDITLYAVYSRTDASGTGTGDYVKVTSAPSDWSGEYVIVYEDGSVIFDGSLTTLDAVGNTQSVTISNNTIAADDADPYKFTIAAYSTGYSIQSASGSYIGKSNDANGLEANSTAVVNTISLNEDKTANIISTGGAYLRYNAASNQLRFRYYRSETYTSQKAIALYVKDGSAGTTYYTTKPTSGSGSGECTHNWKVTKTVAATCTEGGYTLETCSLCGETRKTNVIPALGHDMKTDKVVEATCTAGGYTQLKCSRCSVTETTNVTIALGHNMVAGTAVAATCTQNGYTPYTCSRCGVTEQRNVVPAAGHSYEAVVTEPTYYAQGYTTHTCVNCGDKYVDSYTPALQPAYSITVRVSDEAFGKAFLSDNVVTAVPANGMYASGFLLTPAYSATVVQEGNRFYITDVKEDCVLTIEFRSKDAAKVTFSVPAGCKAESLTGCVGESVELTAPTGKPVADAHDYVFAGWVETPVSEELSKPDAIFTDSYLFTKQSVTLYALYSYVYRGDTYYTTTVRMDTCLAEQFKDVDTTAWYHEALDFVLEYGYMNGVGEFKFEPNGLLTRAMMVTILYRLDGEGEYAAHPFKDVAKDTWYDEAVAWGYATGVVKGTSATTFSPDDYVTREQAATLLYRYAEYCGEDVSTMGSLMGFEDAKQISSFARDAMRWAVGEGIVNGRSETVLEPLGTATRAEIAKILYGWLS
ncbi:MAG: S-layer homology domain-containing protein [Faecousia sp.]